ncbi:ribulose-phosphate 3 epimerase family domain-containing protein [Ditylenchus destructor]|nr:ribulose-phosphate 3 epimerase family domain-containing protein [Ditylenchus destructor]
MTGPARIRPASPMETSEGHQPASTSAAASRRAALLALLAGLAGWRAALAAPPSTAGASGSSSSTAGATSTSSAASTSTGPLTLRSAGQAGVPVKYAFDDPQRPGLCAEIAAAVQRIDPELRIEGLNQAFPLRRLELMLSNGDLDVFFCLLNSEQRRAQMRFLPVPLYRVNHVVAMRAGDARMPKGWDELRKLARKEPLLLAQGTKLASTLQRADVAFTETARNDRDALMMLRRPGGAGAHQHASLRGGRPVRGGLAPAVGRHRGPADRAAAAALGFRRDRTPGGALSLSGWRGGRRAFYNRCLSAASGRAGPPRHEPAPIPHYPQHPVRQLRPPRRGSRQRPRRWRGLGPLRRDGQPLCAEPDHRPDGLPGAAQARRDRADRRAPDGRAGGRAGPGLLPRRRGPGELPPRGQPARRPHDPADQGRGRQGRPGVQPGHAAVLYGLRDGQDRPGADHVGQPRLWRPELHSRRAEEAAAGQGHDPGSGRDIRLEIDGGVKADNIGEIAAAGADTFVAGSAIFRGFRPVRPDPGDGPQGPAGTAGDAAGDLAGAAGVVPLGHDRPGPGRGARPVLRGGQRLRACAGSDRGAGAYVAAGCGGVSPARRRLIGTPVAQGLGALCPTTRSISAISNSSADIEERMRLASSIASRSRPAPRSSSSRPEGPSPDRLIRRFNNSRRI